jgi:hypothetical protein
LQEQVNFQRDDDEICSSASSGQFLMIIFVYCSELSYLEVIDTEQASPKRRKIDVTYLPSFR